MDFAYLCTTNKAHLTLQGNLYTKLSNISVALLRTELTREIITVTKL